MRSIVWKAGCMAILALPACDRKADASAGAPAGNSTAAATAAAGSAAAPPAAAPAAPRATAPAEPTAPKPTVELKIASVGNQMKFDVEELTVKAGDRVHLVLKSNSTLKAMPHNWVLVKPGTEAAVAAAGVESGEKGGWIKEGADVLAHTPLAGPGDTVEVSFTAPAAGTYPYVCTAPGHYLTMKGKLIVKE